MDRWEGRVALVTGASVGIGAACCRVLVAAGMKVVGAARGVEKVQALAKELSSEPGTLYAVKCDVSQDEEVLALFKKIKKEHGGVDVCINNAGYIAAGSLIDGKTEDWRGMLDVNVVALCLATRESIASMRERNVDDGQIIHISSIMAHKGFPGQIGQFYGSTKYAVRSLTEGFRQELKAIKSNIRVASISPGVVETEFLPRMMSGMESVYKNLPYKPLEAKDIADSVLHVLSTPPHVQVHEMIVNPIHGD